ncbi:TetR/AcrR family transcriptional regulator [Saccharothrix sp. 6-C]|uniref:TetR family transcriptional regulator n=1 Tax=Saccharothrix texasensis TaxID=103734 RepID=A0A3N1H312_9PSEU|nr:MULTISPECIES: TetR/AcrR family transcriptional regulator [Saccharothrix]QQQ78452.1 TetR/AcrR family transcriptional regulator [Saccharothrix sp. 6-C]ROP36888.1 TetR family transcriptional regulator [Saccharothrix texasensis]
MSTETGQRDTRRQADRSRETRRKLMEATVECLVERGWAGTTTTEVAERAGVSRGAQLHHFRTRGELVAAAVEHLGAESVLDLKERASRVNGSTVAVVELIADFYASDLFTAALELWVAARTDPDLKTVVVPLEVRLGRETHRLAVELLGADEAKPGVRETVQLTLDLVRGLALANQLTDDGKRRSRIVRHWARVLEELLEGQAP